MTSSESFDAIIVGAGFAGIYQLYRLRDLGLNCRVIDQAGDVGGTWFWNKYPGAMSDTESHVYRFSWDQEDLDTYPFPERYVKQPEVLAYLNHVVERHELRQYMRFRTELLSAQWSDAGNEWNVTVTGDKKIRARYLITGLGLLSKQNFPEIAGLENFAGEMHHTAKWPEGLSVAGKRVGVIGCGSTGVQVITEIARKVESLTCFQRHPQYSVPSGDRKVTAEDRQWINDNWDSIFHRVRHSITGFGIEESTLSYHDTTPEERQRIFQENWDKGNGFGFMFGTFNDLTTSLEANEGACAFIRSKIDEIVTDPEKARKLKPHDIYARRPLCDGNASNGQRYFEQFNRANVEVVDLKATPISRIEAQGIRTQDGRLHELDLIIFATGFDAVDGNYTRIAIQGREGLTLKQAWDEHGPTAYLGMCVPRFPNLFMISGPKGPFTNIPPAVESNVEFITSAIQAGEKSGSGRPIEATVEAEEQYSRLCEELAKDSLFWKAEDNWIFGANIPGKKRCLRFFFGGMQAYHEKLQDCISHDYDGFKDFRSEQKAAA